MTALRLPFLDWLPRYRKDWLRLDIVAGLTTAAVVLPKSMAYATIAGLPIQVGLYTAFVPLIVYAFLGTSRPLSVTTTTTIAILTGAALGEVVPSGEAMALLQASAILTLMVGAILVLASILRLGFVAYFISEPVLVGFKAGIGIVIIIDQMSKILGVHFTKGTFLQNVQSLVLSLPHLSPTTLAVGVATGAGLGAIEKWKPSWPAPLIVIALAIAAVAFFDLQHHGVELVGAIPSGVPAFKLPDFSLASQLWPAAVGIALMSFTETAAVSQAFVAPDEPAPRPNVELFATGMANVGGAFFGAMPGGGGMSQTAVNRMTGARTQIAGLATAAVTLLTMLLLAPLLGLMPHAVLAAVVIVYSAGLIKPADFRAILRIRKTEFFWAVAALIGVMLLGTLKGILVAIIVSLVALAQQSASPRVYVLGRKRGTNVFRVHEADGGDEIFPGLLILRLEGRVFFLNAERIAEQVRTLVAEAKPRVVLIDLSGVFDVEYSALKMFIEAEKRQRAVGVSLWLSGLSPDVYGAVQRSVLAETLGKERLTYNLEIAVERYLTTQSGGAAHA
jgi:high affinity sulfate transporter 1